jgi:hypothetical protein
VTDPIEPEITVTVSMVWDCWNAIIPELIRLGDPSPATALSAAASAILVAAQQQLAPHPPPDWQMKPCPACDGSGEIGCGGLPGPQDQWLCRWGLDAAWVTSYFAECDPSYNCPICYSGGMVPDAYQEGTCP